MKTPFVAVLCLALCGVTAWKFAESGQLKQQIASLEMEVATWKAAAQKPPLVSKEETKPKAEASMQAPSDDTKIDKKPEAKKDAPGAAFAKALETMLTSDASKKMMKEASKGMLETMYKDLFDLLELDPEAKKALMDILADKQQEEQALGMKLFTNSNMTAEERDALIKQIKENHDSSEAKIKGLLKDPTKIDQYQKFQDSAPERQQIAGLKTKLASDGQPMTEDQEQAVMNTLYSERKAMKWDHDYTDQRDVSPEKFTDDAIARYEEQTKEYDQKVEQRLTGLLNQEQLESFRGQRAQQRSMEKMGLTFGKAMFGGGQK